VHFDSVYNTWLSLCVHGKCAQRHTLPLTKHVQLFVELRAVSEYDKWNYTYDCLTKKSKEQMLNHRKI
jgi:hypothetical protein